MRPVDGRLHAQLLGGPRHGSLLEVVRHLGCVQSQMHDMALWGVGRRLTGATLADLQRSFAAGDVVRTHVLRPTWHLVAPDDLHWLQALTGSRVRRLTKTTNRSIGLSPDVVEQGAALVVEALADGRPRTRRELADVLAAAGLVLTGQAVAHVLMDVEIDAAIASGPMAGKQHTYRLVEPHVVTASRDELLAQVARRYAAGHGPIRDRDLAWWTSLTLTDSRRAIELGDLRPLDVDGVTHWMLDESVASEPPEVMLLPNFDEYSSYARTPDDYRGIAALSGEVMRATGLLFVAGRLAGSWTRSLTATTATIDVLSAARPTASLRRGLQAEAEAFGRFVDREPRLRIGD